MVKKSIRKCAECGRIYTPTVNDPSQSYLCPECAKERRDGAVYQEKKCAKCGRKFLGFPKSKYCEQCALIAKKENKKIYEDKGAKRPIGSKDICARCGNEYIIKGGLQKYCPECARQANLEKQRERKKAQREQKKRADTKKKTAEERIKICVYCGNEFNNTVSGNLCSEECREKQKKLNAVRVIYRKGKASDARMKRYEEAQQKEWAKNRGHEAK